MHISRCISLPFGQVHTQDTGLASPTLPPPPGCPSLLPPSHDTQTIPGAAQRPHPSEEESSSSLSDSLWDMQQSVHWTNRPDTQPTAERTEQSPDIRKPSAISYRRASMEEMYVIDWKEVQVMNSYPHYTQQCTLEVWHIKSERNNLNRDVGYPPITPSFITLNPPQSCSPPFTTYLDSEL